MNGPQEFASDYISGLVDVFREIPEDSIADIIGCLIDAYRGGRRVFIFGNGGSAATASHMAVDLGKTVLADASPAAVRFYVTALTDNVPWMTAIANDISYDSIFSEQLRNLASEGDVVIAITGSGNSPNIVEGLKAATELGCVTVALLGFDGGLAVGIVDHHVLVPSHDYGYVEDAHLALNHLVTRYLKFAIASGDLTEPS